MMLIKNQSFDWFFYSKKMLHFSNLRIKLKHLKEECTDDS